MIGLFIFSLSSWLSLGKLYLCKNFPFLLGEIKKQTKNRLWNWDPWWMGFFFFFFFYFIARKVNISSSGCAGELGKWRMYQGLFCYLWQRSNLLKWLKQKGHVLAHRTEQIRVGLAASTGSSELKLCLRHWFPCFGPSALPSSWLTVSTEVSSQHNKRTSALAYIFPCLSQAKNKNKINKIKESASLPSWFKQWP